MTTRGPTPVRGLTLQKEATHYPMGMPARAFYESRFTSHAPWSLLRGPSEPAEGRQARHITILKKTSVGCLTWPSARVPTEDGQSD